MFKLNTNKLKFPYKIVFIFSTFILSATFSFLSHFHLSTSVYLNITFHISLYLRLFHFLLFLSSYYKIIIIFSILYFYAQFSLTKKVISLSQFFVGFFFKKFFLHPCFRLLIFCIFKNSTLS